MNPEMTRHTSKLLVSATTPVDTITTPLLESIDLVLSNLYTIMLKANFLRFLELLWHSILDQILAVTLANKTVRMIT